MGIFDKLFGSKPASAPNTFIKVGVIANGPQKATGGHDHRYNTKDDRTPAQKKADKQKKK
jgi:hypothetical protein